MPGQSEFTFRDFFFFWFISLPHSGKVFSYGSVCFVYPIAFYNPAISFLMVNEWFPHHLLTTFPSDLDHTIKHVLNSYMYSSLPHRPGPCVCISNTLAVIYAVRCLQDKCQSFLHFCMWMLLSLQEMETLPLPSSIPGLRIALVGINRRW